MKNVLHCRISLERQLIIKTRDVFILGDNFENFIERTLKSLWKGL